MPGTRLPPSKLEPFDCFNAPLRSGAITAVVRCVNDDCVLKLVDCFQLLDQPFVALPPVPPATDGFFHTSRFRSFKSRRTGSRVWSLCYSLSTSDSITPSRKRMTRLARAATSSSWVIMTMVFPPAFRDSNRSRTSSVVFESRFPVASSARTK